jgi:hypothetical protein
LGESGAALTEFVEHPDTEIIKRAYKSPIPKEANFIGNLRREYSNIVTADAIGV